MESLSCPEPLVYVVLVICKGKEVRQKAMKKPRYHEGWKVDEKGSRKQCARIWGPEATYLVKVNTIIPGYFFPEDFVTSVKLYFYYTLERHKIFINPFKFYFYL